MLAALPPVQAAAADDTPPATRSSYSDSAVDQAVARFIQTRGDKPFWIVDGAPGKNARRLVQLLQHADQDGLDPQWYNAADLAHRIDHVSDLDWERKLETDLSRALIDYVRDVRWGVVKNRMDYTDDNIDWHVPSPATILASAAAAPDFVEWMHQIRGVNPLYRRLRLALAQIRAAPDDAYTTIPSGDLVHPGESDSRIPVLRKRLGVTVADNSGANTPDPQQAQANNSGPGNTLDPQTVQALKNFQRAHGLSADGVLGPGTLAMLNQSRDAQIDLVRANMERARWLPHGALGAKFVLVNIPQYEVHMYQRGKEPQLIKAVVGEAGKQTPLMVDRIEYAEVNPYWNLPPDITAKEIVPEVQSHGVGYLRSKDMEVVRDFNPDTKPISPGSVSWTKAAALTPKFLVRQRPGKQNALGQIKFMFPNPNAIYLHDTPADSLFSRSARDDSHGCVRLGRPLDFAAWLFDGQGIDKTKFQKLIATGKHQNVGLNGAVPVYLGYFTAWPDDKGNVAFQKDVYERDSGLIAAIKKS
ncbi:L,D-transpeptidase family protein [Stakelama flava]|uniref:L,D-transpeptidase family protein n=1 Tax=Stakelama flava TaxID=2860338 RepID=UPI001C5AF44F